MSLSIKEYWNTFTTVFCMVLISPIILAMFISCSIVSILAMAAKFVLRIKDDQPEDSTQ